MEKTKRLIIFLVMFAFLLTAVGCSSNGKIPIGDSTSIDTGNASFTISGLANGDITATLDEIQAMDAYEGRVEGADSAGYPVVYDIKGAYFADLLEIYGYSQDELAGIRIIASDGYSIEVSSGILQARDIILAYEIDGKPLTEVSAPLRVFIPEERAMYWVKKVTKIEVMYSEQPDIVTGIYIMETLYSSRDYEDYEYLGSTYKVLNTKKILDAYPGTKGDILYLIASDGLEKNETLENFYKGVINMSGEKAPQFMSSTLPSGMFVKEMLMFKYGGNAFYFLNTALHGKTQIALNDLLSACGLESSDEYDLNFKNNNDTAVKSSELEPWMIGMEGGKVYICQDGTVEKFRDFISITIKQQGE